MPARRVVVMHLEITAMRCVVVFDRRLVLGCLFTLLAVCGGCNTIEGVGEDMQSMGRQVGDATRSDSAPVNPYGESR